MTVSKQRSPRSKPAKAKSRRKTSKQRKPRRKPASKTTRMARLVRGVRRVGSVLERLVNLIGDVGIIVTAATKWKDIGFDNDSLDTFCRVQVSDEFGKPFEGADAGSTVGDLVKSINRALG